MRTMLEVLLTQALRKMTLSYEATTFLVIRAGQPC